MDRKHFLKSVLLTTGGVLLGGTTIYRYLNSKETTDASLPSLIDKIHQGNMKKILVIMSAGTKRGNTDRLTDAYIKGLVERGHSVTKVYLGAGDVECASVLHISVLFATAWRIYILCLRHVIQWLWLLLFTFGQLQQS